MNRRDLFKGLAATRLPARNQAAFAAQTAGAGQRNGIASPSPVWERNIDESLRTAAMSGRTQMAWEWWDEPYRLTNHVHLFTDWRWVRAGGSRDHSANSDPMPSGIVIRSQPAEVSEPLPGIFPGTVIYDGGKYRLWYELIEYRVHDMPEMNVKPEAEVAKIRKRWTNLLLYAESEDGFHWKLPEFNLVDPADYASNGLAWKNVVFGGPRAGDLHQPGVFVDPSARQSERYKMIYGDSVGGPGREAEGRAMIEFYRKNRPDDLDPNAIRRPESYQLACLAGATSPDGYHWTRIKKPLLLFSSDTTTAAYYDESIRKYVWYGRIWALTERRCVARSETSDFRSFPTPEIVIRPTANDDPTADWYTNAKTNYPGTPGEHLMFPTQYRRDTDCGVLYLYSSRDGIYWDQVPGGPVVTQGPYGQPFNSWIRPWVNLLPLPNEHVGLMCDAQLLSHKHPRGFGKAYQDINRYRTFWAMWPKGRLSAVEADGFGTFATPGVLVHGRKLVLNVQTKTKGEVRVAVASRHNKPSLEGRGFDDCDPIRGDRPSQVVTWRGASDLGHKEGEPIVLRFRMRMAKLFSFQIT